MAFSARIPDAAQSMTPMSVGERIDVIDILRGWAILGMLVVNFSHDLDWTWWFTKVWPGTADRQYPYRFLLTRASDRGRSRGRCGRVLCILFGER